MSDHLFVYGTLMRGTDGDLHPLLRGLAEYLGTASIAGKLYLLKNYPGAVSGNSEQSRIRGEIYRLQETEKLLASLDDYEECSASYPVPHEYQRCRLPVLMSAGRTQTAWVYLYNLAYNELTQISDGDYRLYLNANKLL